MEWSINITYGLTPFELKAEVVYESNQIMRIKVQGKSSCLLLENNYPMLKLTNSQKGIQWKLREGHLKNGNSKDAELLISIMDQLESLIKKEYSYR